MKHEPVAIRLPDLIDRLDGNIEYPFEFLGIHDETIDRLAESRPEGVLSANCSIVEDAIEQRERELLHAHRDTWFIVKWPEHVLTPRFNGDATYAQCKSKADALADGALEYGR